MEKFSPFWSEIRSQKGGRLLKIAFTDTSDPRILEAVHRLGDENLVNPVLIGQGVDINESDRHRFVDILVQSQSRYKLTPDAVSAQLKDPLYVAIAMLLDGSIDGLVAGSLRPTAEVVKAALQCIGPKSGQRFVSGHFLMESTFLSTFDRTPFLFADCAVMPEPSSQSLALIARSAADSYHFFTGKQPRVAFLSFSTRGSAQHKLVDRITEAVALVKKQDPNLLVDGEIQVDAALNFTVAKIKKASDSPLEGKANVLIFPTLEAGNISYKLVQRFSEARVAGPLLWGLNKPMSDLSRGCSVEEVIDTALCVSALAGRLN